MESEKKKMGVCRLTSWSIFLPLLVMMMCANGSGGREMTMSDKTTATNVLSLHSSTADGVEKSDADHQHGHQGTQKDAKHVLADHVTSSHMDHKMDPSLTTAFYLDDIKVGKTLPAFFPKPNPSPPPLLPRAVADSIPFSSSQFPKLLQLLSISENSQQAKLMQQTLTMCENPALEGETKVCATSLESMLDFVRSNLGPDTRFQALATTKTQTLLQNYTVMKVDQVFSEGEKVVQICHVMPYFYTIFYCHSSPDTDTKVFKISLAGENGEGVEALSVCHMDTSKWSLDPGSFQTIGIQKGMPVCHFLSWDTYVWVPILPTSV